MASWARWAQVVVATNIAETSVTIDGIRFVATWTLGGWMMLDDV